VFIFMAMMELESRGPSKALCIHKQMEISKALWYVIR
jgi:hypothetical protein